MSKLTDLADIHRMNRLVVDVNTQHVICDASKGFKIGTVLKRIMRVNEIRRGK